MNEIIKLPFELELMKSTKNRLDKYINKYSNLIWQKNQKNMLSLLALKKKY